MKLIVGLGNPGPQYVDTRHNVGYRVADSLHARWGCDGWREKFSGLYAQCDVGNERVILLKPMTFMNLSGKSVVAAGSFFKVEPADMLVIGDDLDLAPGKIRLRGEGSSGGQNGLKDVVQRLGTNAVPRLRIGIGRPTRGDVVSFILGRFDKSDEEWLPSTVERSSQAAEKWVRDGLSAAMNEYNRNDRDSES